jgi:hypothetical protein
VIGRAMVNKKSKKMVENNPVSELQLKNLSSFLEKNQHIEFTNADLNNAGVVEGFDWQKLKNQKEEVLDALQAYQRLKKIMPELSQNTAIALLKAGIHSALQIAALPKIKFLHEYAALFGENPAAVEQFYNQALAIRTQILLQYMEVKQANEPHLSTAKI